MRPLDALSAEDWLAKTLMTSPGHISRWAGGFYAKTLDMYLVITFIVRFLGVSSVTSDDVTGLRIYVLQMHASRQSSFGVVNSLI